MINVTWLIALFVKRSPNRFPNKRVHSVLQSKRLVFCLEIVGDLMLRKKHGKGVLLCWPI